MHTAEPLVPEPSAFEVELTVVKLKRRKSPGIDQISSEIHKLVISICNKRNCLRSGRIRFIVPIHKKGDKTNCSN